MRKSLDQVLKENGYRPSKPATGRASVFVKRTPAARFLVCLLHDRGTGFGEGVFRSTMEAECRRVYAEDPSVTLYPIAVVLTPSAALCRQCCQGRFACWYLDEGLGRVVIYEDQPASFADLRPLLTEAFEGGTADVSSRSFGRRRTRLFRLTPVNIGLIVLNIGIFILIEALGSSYSADLMYKFGAVYVRELTLTSPGQWWRLLACAFLHFGFSHLFNNMLVLLYMGDNLEVELGSVRYLAFYLLCAVISSAVSVVWYHFTGETNVLSAGASGAIFGVVGGLLATIIRRRRSIEDIGIIQLLLLVGFTLYHGIQSAGVNNSAHLGGLAAGFVLALAMYSPKGENG